jgi:hypothetical protein
LTTVEGRVAGVRKAVSLLAEHGDDGVVAVAGALAIWIDQAPAATITFDDALNLPPGWRSALRRQQRDQALLRLWRHHFVGLQGREAVRAVSAAARRYEGTGWPRDRRTGRRPDGLNGDLFDVLCLGSLPAEGSLRRLFQCLSRIIQGASDAPGGSG